MLEGASSSSCVFPDVLGFFTGLEDREQHFAADYMQKLRAVSAAVYKGSGVCLRHGAGDGASPRHAECPVPAVDLEVAGLPCTDFSTAGLRMAEQGPTLLVHLAWARKMSEEQPPLILHENVPQYPTPLLEQHLGGWYHLYTMLVSPADAGFALQSRRRRYTMLVHKTKVVLTRDPYEVYAVTPCSSRRPPQMLCWQPLRTCTARLRTFAQRGASGRPSLQQTCRRTYFVLGRWGL